MIAAYSGEQLVQRVFETIESKIVYPRRELVIDGNGIIHRNQPVLAKTDYHERRRRLYDPNNQAVLIQSSTPQQNGKPRYPYVVDWGDRGQVAVAYEGQFPDFKARFVAGEFMLPYNPTDDPAIVVAGLLARHYTGVGMSGTKRPVTLLDALGRTMYSIPGDRDYAIVALDLRSGEIAYAHRGMDVQVAISGYHGHYVLTHQDEPFGPSAIALRDHTTYTSRSF